MPELAAASGGATPDQTGEREVWFEGSGLTASKVHERALLLAGHEIAGPAVIEQEDSTVLVPPSWHALVDRAGNIVISRQGKEG